MLDTLTAADWKYLEAMPLFLRLGPEQRGEPETRRWCTAGWCRA